MRDQQRKPLVRKVLSREQRAEAFRECDKDPACRRYANHKGYHGNAIGRRWPQ